MTDRAELRCPSNKMHGILTGRGTMEIKCDSRLCGAGQGWAVIHEFNLTTGELVNTSTYKNPPTPERMAR